MRITTLALMLVLLAGIGAGAATLHSPSYYIARHRVSTHIVKVVGQGGGVSQDAIDAAWKDALEIGGGDPDWKCPLTPERVVVVPSTLALGPYVFYGITVTEPALVDGKLVMVETVEIHLAKNMSCHVGQVLRHELLHVVATRRHLTDHDFAKEIERAGDEEKWVRTVYPVADMGICSE